MDYVIYSYFTVSSLVVSGIGEVVGPRRMSGSFFLFVGVKIGFDGQG